MAEVEMKWLKLEALTEMHYSLENSTDYIII